MSYLVSRFEKSPIVKIQTLDYTYDGFEGASSTISPLVYLLTSGTETSFSLSPWMTIGPLCPEPEVYESGTTPDLCFRNANL